MQVLTTSQGCSDAALKCATTVNVTTINLVLIMGEACTTHTQCNL